MASLPWPHWLSSAAPSALSHGWPAPASSAVPFEWPRGALLPPHDPSLCRLASSLLWAGAGGLGPRVLGPPASPGLRGGGAPGEPGPVSPQTERLTAEQIKEYEGVFEMFDEEGNRAVKTDELERLTSLLGINPTKSELASMAKDVDREREAGQGQPGGEKAFFNCEGFLALMGVYWEKAQNQESELRAAFRIFDKEGKGYIDWGTLKYVLTHAGEPLSEVEAEQMMKEADKDKDGDGTIDYEEFVAMMTGESFKLVQ
ncbi:calmodulin-like protein 6 [Megaptera novaeangliae]